MSVLMYIDCINKRPKLLTQTIGHIFNGPQTLFAFVVCLFTCLFFVFQTQICPQHVYFQTFPMTLLFDVFFIYISNFTPFPRFPSKTSLSHSPSTCSPTHPLLLPFSSHSPPLGNQDFTGPRASPFIDVQQGPPLLYMWLEPWAPPCVLFD